MNLARSKSLWERRIAIVATFAFIRKGDVEDTLKIAEMLLIDTEDLIHKATGWMLREVLKSTASQKGILFLDVYHKTMPRTALRYAIERLSLSQRKVYMRK
jgi:3-methyladenine DNA glycosylase AlkD